MANLFGKVSRSQTQIADAGYNEAIEFTEKNDVKVPMIE
jgi:urocanate hydratase